jgi:hypothetical protein
MPYNTITNTSSSGGSSTVPIGDDYMLGAADLASRTVSDRMTPYMGERAAPLSQGQLDAMNLQRSGIGSYTPFLGAAATQATAAPGIYGAAVPEAQGLMRGSTYAFDPATQTQSYMDPYQQQVLDATERQMTEANLQQQNQLAGQAVGAGAFGGSRFDIAQAGLAEKQARGMTEALAGIRSQGYGNALGAAMDEHERVGKAQLLAGTGIAGLGYKGAGLANEAASQFSGLGAKTQAQLAGDVSSLTNIGNMQQQQQQSQMAANQQYHEEVQQEPYAAASWYSNVLKGMPSTQQASNESATNTTQVYNPIIRGNPAADQQAGVNNVVDMINQSGGIDAFQNILNGMRGDPNG